MNEYTRRVTAALALAEEAEMAADRLSELLSADPNDERYILARRARMYAWEARRALLFVPGESRSAPEYDMPLWALARAWAPPSREAGADDLAEHNVGRHEFGALDQERANRTPLPNTNAPSSDEPDAPAALA